VGVGLVLSDVFCFGFLKFGYYVMKCGYIPVVVNPSAFGIGQSGYILPGNYMPGGADGTYFCTEADAKAAGFEKDKLGNM
jgi:hypothetical protein